MAQQLKELMEFAKNLKLLYVEDDESSRLQTLDILKIFFKDIIVAKDGKEGIEKFDNNKIDFVITDINMPKVNGLKFTEHIRDKDKDIPVFILSAHSDTGFFLDSISLGVDGYILKPIESTQFIDQVRKKVQKLYLQQQLKEYHQNLEMKVKEQVEQLREKDKILIQQSKLATMGEMMDIIAHQWKQPINIISMNSSLVKEFFEGGIEVDKELIDTCYEKVSSQIKHLVSTLDDFRAFFRPNEKTEKVNLKTLLEKVQLLIHDDIIKNNINLEIDVDEAVILEVNQSEIKHIFINLINNARDAFNQKGIKERLVTVSSRIDNGTLIVSVQDNAGGIPENIIRDIFNANFTTKGKSGGTGIGLYMSRFIAKKNHASLSVENKKGGACFSLRFDYKL